MVRWRDEEWDEEMTSEMKRWNFFLGSEHMSSQILCYLKSVRWRDKQWDEEMKSEMKRWKNNILVPNIRQAKSGVIWNEWDEEWDEEMKNFFFWVRTCQAKSGVILN